MIIREYTPRTRAGAERYCLGEYAVGRMIVFVTRATRGPSFSVSANAFTRSGSALKPAHALSRCRHVVEGEHVGEAVTHADLVRPEADHF